MPKKKNQNRADEKAQISAAETIAEDFSLPHREGELALLETIESARSSVGRALLLRNGAIGTIPLLGLIIFAVYKMGPWELSIGIGPDLSVVISPINHIVIGVLGGSVWAAVAGAGAFTAHFNNKVLETREREQEARGYAKSRDEIELKKSKLAELEQALEKSRLLDNNNTRVFLKSFVKDVPVDSKVKNFVPLNFAITDDLSNYRTQAESLIGFFGRDISAAKIITLANTYYNNHPDTMSRAREMLDDARESELDEMRRDFSDHAKTLDYQSLGKIDNELVTQIIFFTHLVNVVKEKAKADKSYPQEVFPQLQKALFRYLVVAASAEKDEDVHTAVKLCYELVRDKEEEKEKNKEGKQHRDPPATNDLTNSSASSLRKRREHNTGEEIT